MEPEVIGTLGVLSNKARTAVLKVLGFRNDKVSIVGEYYTLENTVQSYTSTITISTRMSNSSTYDSLVDNGYTYYSEVVVPAPGRYQIINDTYDVNRTRYSRIPIDRNPLPIGTFTEPNIHWDYLGEFIDVQICTYNVVDARLNVSRWAGIKAIVNAHREKELLHLGQIIEAPAGLNSVSGGSAQFAVFSIDDVPGYPHAVIFGPTDPLIGPRGISITKSSTNKGGYYNSNLSITLDTSYYSSLPTELQQVISPRQATYTSGSKGKVYYPETHRVWLPRLSELVTQGADTRSSGELTTSSYYLELDGRVFGLAKSCQYHPASSTMLNDDNAGTRIYYRYAIWTSSPSVVDSTKFATISAAGKVALTNSITKTVYAAPFFMISADDDSCEYHYLKMKPDKNTKAL